MNNVLTINYINHVKNIIHLFQEDPIDYSKSTHKKITIPNKTLSEILEIGDIIICELDCYKLQ